MSTPTADRTPRRTTGHPAKASGGRMTKEEWRTAAMEYFHARLSVYVWPLNEPLPIPPDDYARHWELEGPHA